MGWVAKLAGVQAADGGWANDDDRWYSGETNLPRRTNSGRRVTPELALNFSAVYAAVNLMSKAMGSIPLGMYKRDAQGRYTECPEHPIHDLLAYQPNAWQTAFDFRAMLMMHVCLRGNGFAEIIPGARGFAHSLEPIHPDLVTKVDQLGDGTLRYYVQDARRGQRILLQSEVLHFRSPIAPAGFLSVSPITYARETIGLALAAEEHGARMFSNGARPSGVVEIGRKLSDASFERLKSEFNTLFTGLSNSSKTPILEEGAVFKPITMTANDAQFLGSREFQVEEIARWFDVPPVMLHHMTNQSSWGTGVEQIMLGFVRNSLMPVIAGWTQVIRRDLIIAPHVYEARFDIEDLIAGDAAAKSNFYRSMVLAGILTRNEAREALGYNTMDGLDEPLVPVSTAKDEEPPANPRKNNNPAGNNNDTSSTLLGHNGGPSLDPVGDEHANPETTSQ